MMANVNPHIKMASGMSPNGGRESANLNPGQTASKSPPLYVLCEEHLKAKVVVGAPCRYVDPQGKEHPVCRFHLFEFLEAEVKEETQRKTLQALEKARAERLERLKSE